jgi:hypothetical protein
VCVANQTKTARDWKTNACLVTAADNLKTSQFQKDKNKISDDDLVVAVFQRTARSLHHKGEYIRFCNPFSFSLSFDETEKVEEIGPQF